MKFKPFHVLKYSLAIYWEFCILEKKIYLGKGNFNYQTMNNFLRYLNKLINLWKKIDTIIMKYQVTIELLLIILSKNNKSIINCTGKWSTLLVLEWELQVNCTNK